MDFTEKEWDVFVSHASEDKDRFVRPLAESLRSLGVLVWYDEFSLSLGDSLSRSIDKGLANSRYGLVVLSHNFIKKPWAEYELRGLVAREIDEDKVIVPIWHGITRNDVLRFSPTLADKIAVSSDGLSAEDISILLLRVIRPDIYYSQPRDELHHIKNRKAISDLQSELEVMHEELKETKQKLSLYRCPTCNAPLSSKLEAPVDDDQKYWDVREVYACGHQVFGGVVEVLCPSDPDFPLFTEYDLKTSKYMDIPLYRWKCVSQPKTDKARKYRFSVSYGDTEDEAKDNAYIEYNKYQKRKYI